MDPIVISLNQNHLSTAGALVVSLVFDPSKFSKLLHNGENDCVK